ncbi:MAG: glycosyltransferase family 39 protein [Pirellulaceae bacterium]|nr:glycosyltransferase family 39 protein [Pirellulaceae bacterium]
MQNKPGTFIFWITIGAIFVFALILNLSNNHFPLGYHFDEPKKVRFILTGAQDFHHPILMLELVRWANSWQTSRSPQEVAELGRTVMAIIGACVPVVTILMSGPYLGRMGAVLVGGVLAVTPTMVLHSHYLKEDMLLVLMSAVALGGFSQYCRTRHEGWLFFAGLFWGLAMGSHYKGLLVGVAALPFLLLDRTLMWRPRLLLAMLVVGLAGLGFLLPNAIIFEQWGTFVSGFNHERNHALTGHFVPILWSDFYLTYHLQYSLLPGMTYGLGAMAVGSVFWWTFRWSELERGERIWLSFVWVSYLVPEISPLKPNPDEARYILPAIPGLIFFTVKSFQTIWAVCLRENSSTAATASSWARHRRPLWCYAAAMCGIVAIGLAAYDAVLLNHYLVRDTRAALERWAEGEGIQLAGEPMTGTDLHRSYAYDENFEHLREQGYTHYAISSFAYDPYLVTANLPRQLPHVEARRSVYVDLLRKGSHEFKPQHRSFGFSNPNLIVVPLQK